MRKIKDVLRLKLDAKMSHQQIAGALGISKGVVTKYVGLGAAAGVDWTTAQGFDETAWSGASWSRQNDHATMCNPITAACTRSCAARA